MNEITFIEYTDHGIKRTIVNDINFYNDVLRFCISTFDQANSDIRTFAFVLNDEKSNSFNEQLTNEKFIDHINVNIKDSITILWCQPNILDPNKIETPYQYFTKVENANSHEIWQNLAKHSKINQVNGTFPMLLLLKVLRKDSVLEIVDVESVCFKMDTFANVVDFQTYFLKLLNDVIKVADLTSNNKPIFESKDLLNSFIKGGLIGAGKKAFDYLSDGFEKLKEIDLKDFLYDILKNGPN